MLLDFCPFTHKFESTIMFASGILWNHFTVDSILSKVTTTNSPRCNEHSETTHYILTDAKYTFKNL
jgi:hypothetical protein